MLLDLDWEELIGVKFLWFVDGLWDVICCCYGYFECLIGKEHLKDENFGKTNKNSTVIRPHWYALQNHKYSTR